MCPPTPSETPIRVRLSGFADLAKGDLEEQDFLAWLTAPIAGEPLYKRTLQVLLSLRIAELVIDPGPVGDAVLRLFKERPIHNLKARMAPTEVAISPKDIATLVVPVGGLLEADLAGLQARGEQAGRIERTPVSLPLQEGRKIEIVYLPPGHSAEEIDTSMPATDIYAPAPPILRATNHSVALRETAQRALEHDLEAFPPVGEWKRELLLGKGAEVHPTVRIIGKAAVGSGSVVGPRVLLGHGAMIGEGCRIGEGTHLTHTMVLDRTEIEPNTRLLGVVRLPGGGEA
jgi:transferase family hexapeptide repeat protein